MPGDRFPRLVAILIVAAACGLGLWLRIVGLRYGLPAVYNPDEVAIMNRALQFGTGDLNPHNFLYPTLYFYVLFAWEGAFALAGRATGLFASIAAFERSYFVDPTLIFTAGRALSAVCGVATIAATAVLATRVAGRAAGAIAACFMAVAPLAVRDAHYVKHDVPVTLLIVLAHVALARVLIDTDSRRTMRWWAMAGLLGGLAASTHYYAVFIVVPIAIAAIFAADATDSAGVRLKRLVIAGLACAIAFIAASPYLLVEPQTAYRDIVANRQIVMDRATDDFGFLGSLGFYVSWLARDASGTVVMALSLAGIAVTIRDGWRPAVALLAFPILFLLFIANTYPASRYLNPVLPFVAVLAAVAVTRVLSVSRWRVPLAVGVVAVVAAATIEGAMASGRANAFFRQEDTRSQALAWVHRSIVPGASILVQPYSVPLRMSHAALVEALRRHLGSEDRASIKFRKQLDLVPYPAPAYRAIYLGVGGLDVDRIYVDPASIRPETGLDPLRALSVEYVVLKRYNDVDPSPDSLVTALSREARVVASFSPYRPEVEAAQRATVAPFLHNTDARIDPALERPGPTIEIWRIN